MNGINVQDNILNLINSVETGSKTERNKIITCKYFGFDTG